MTHGTRKLQAHKAGACKAQITHGQTYHHKVVVGATSPTTGISGLMCPNKRAPGVDMQREPLSQIIYDITPKDTPFLQFYDSDLRTILRFSQFHPQVTKWANQIKEQRHGKQDHEWIKDDLHAIREANHAMR
jgi:hypothetical protein